MASVTFVHPTGGIDKFDVAGPTTVMQLAVEHGIGEVIAECGGSMMCGTCHVYVDDEDSTSFPPPTEDEEDLLVFGEEIRRPGSRLACQLTVTPDGRDVTIGLPREQP